ACGRNPAPAKIASESCMCFLLRLLWILPDAKLRWIRGLIRPLAHIAALLIFGLPYVPVAVSIEPARITPNLLHERRHVGIAALLDQVRTVHEIEPARFFFRARLAADHNPIHNVTKWRFVKSTGEID